MAQTKELPMTPLTGSLRRSRRALPARSVALSLALVLAPTLLTGSPSRATVAPVTVSPGSTYRLDSQTMSRVEGRCPTFSWGSVPGAVAFEVIVYVLPDGFEHVEVWPLASPDRAAPALRMVVPGTANSWTPSLPDCLDAGSKNAWFVRAVRAADGAESAEETSSEWSEPRLFEIAEPRGITPEEALEALRQHAEAEGVDRVLAALGVGSSPLPAPFDGSSPGAVGHAIGDHAARVRSGATATAQAAFHAGLGATTGQTVGVRGVTNSDEGGSAGVFGWSTSVTTTGGLSGMGVYGRSETIAGVGVRGEGATGVWGQSDAFNGIALLGHSGGGTGANVGVRGQCISPAGRGVYGHNFATTGAGHGVFGQSDSSSGIGVYGTGGTGVRGENNTAGGVGVSGYTNDGIGVSGVADNATGTITGVYGETTSSQGYAVYARGHSSALALRAESTSGNHIAAYKSGSSRVFYVDNDGDVFADKSYNCGLASSCFNTGVSADIAERIDVLETLEAGDVVEIDPDLPGLFRRSRSGYSTLVAGVVSSQAGITLNNNDLVDNDDGERSDNRPLLALAGKVPVKASAENGAIRPGDLLTTAATPGHAARCVGAKRCFGRTIGKALEPLTEGTGFVLAVVNLQ
jgi:hypothetical protein